MNRLHPISRIPLLLHPKMTLKKNLDLALVPGAGEVEEKEDRQKVINGIGRNLMFRHSRTKQGSMILIYPIN